ncbi:hypothetical protein CUA68_21040, partial [Shigella boydii]
HRALSEHKTLSVSWSHYRIIQLFRTEQNQAYYNCESIIDIYLRLFTDLVTNNTTDSCTT